MSCYFCGGQLIWNTDENTCDVYCGEYDEDDDGIVSVWTCSRCGRMYEIIDPPREMKSDYPEYWGEEVCE